MTMRSKLQLLVASMAVLLVAGSAHAVSETVAGWDFSQYNGDGSLDTDDDFVGEGTLDANYSNRVGGDGAGAAAHAYGTMYIDGTNGSTLTDYEFGFPAEFAASAGSLSSNLTAPQDTGGLVPFDTCPQDGQSNCLSNSMKAIAAVNVVFEATLAPEGLMGDMWMVSFGAQTENTSKNISVEFSVDGSNYTSFGDVLATSTDGAFSVDFSSFDTGANEDFVDSVWVRLGFTGTDLDGTKIDNVAISANNIVPEPGTAALLLTGLLGLASYRRRG